MFSCTMFYLTLQDLCNLSIKLHNFKCYKLNFSIFILHFILHSSSKTTHGCACTKENTVPGSYSFKKSFFHRESGDYSKKATFHKEIFGLKLELVICKNKAYYRDDKGKVKAHKSQGGLRGRSLSWFLQNEATESISTPP